MLGDHFEREMCQWVDDRLRKDTDLQSSNLVVKTRFIEIEDDEFDLSDELGWTT